MKGDKFMNLKKILWIVLFIVILVCFIAIIATSTRKENKNLTVSNAPSSISNEKISGTINSENKDPYKITELDDGTLYSLNGNQVEADVKLGDKYFDTTIRDMNINPSDYVDKKIQIEGLYFTNRVLFICR